MYYIILLKLNYILVKGFLMYKKILIIPLIILLSNCSKPFGFLSNDSPVRNPITGKESKPGLLSKDGKKGVNLTELFSEKNNSAGVININAFLWRASLNVLSIAPLISTDALGGTIISDWYINKNIKNQRLKITAFILTQELRSDGIKVKVHIQNFKNNVWSETFTDNDLANEIEENILNEARNLRINSLNKK